MSFLRSPADLVQPRQLLVRKAKLQKSFYRLMGSLQSRSIYFLKRNIFIPVKESLRLLSAPVIQVGVHTTALHNVLKIVIGLSVTDQVNFFAVQFLRYFKPSIAASGPRFLKGSAKIEKLLVQPISMGVNNLSDVHLQKESYHRRSEQAFEEHVSRTDRH